MQQLELAMAQAGTAGSVGDTELRSSQTRLGAGLCVCEGVWVSLGSALAVTAPLCPQEQGQGAVGPRVPLTEELDSEILGGPFQLRRFSDTEAWSVDMCLLQKCFQPCYSLELRV